MLNKLIFAFIIFKAFKIPSLVELMFIFFSKIFEFLLINAATIKKALLDKSEGTEIFFDFNSFSPIIFIILFTILTQSCATTMQLYVDPHYKIQPDRSYPELQVGIKINVGPKITLKKRENK